MTLNQMIFEFKKHSVQPGITALAMNGNIHCGPECARLEKEVDALIAAVQFMIVYSLKLTRIDKLIEIFPTIDQAAHGFSSQGSTTAPQA
jgi:hypothetical protein